MLQSELMISAQVKAEGDPLKSFRDKQDELLKERATFVEAISTIDEELTKIRRDMRREEKRLKIYKNVNTRIFEFVKENEGKYTTTEIFRFFEEKGFGKTNANIDSMLASGYLIRNEQGFVNCGIKKERSSVKKYILSSFTENKWLSSGEINISNQSRSAIATRLSQYANKGELDADTSQMFNRYRITQKGLEWLRGQAL